MKRLRLLLAAVGTFCLTFSANAQFDKNAYRSYFQQDFTKWTVGGSVALAGLNSDIAAWSDIKNQNHFINPNLALHVNYRLTNFISLRYQLGFLRLSADPNEAWATEAVPVRTNIVESMIGIRHDFVSRHRLETQSTRVNAYIGLTAGYLYFTPYAKSDGSNLRESVNNAYTPLDGVYGGFFGIEYYVSQGLAIGLELNSRMSMTDWLDGASSSEAGFSTSDDGYFTWGLRVAYTIPVGFKIGGGVHPHHYNYQRHLKKARRRHHY